MQPSEGPSRRPVLYWILGICAVLVVIGAVLPSPKARELQERRYRLSQLTPIKPPGSTSNPAIWMRWKNDETQRLGRDLTVHVYLDLTHPTTRYDLVSNTYSTSRKALNRTIIHLRFDPKDAAQLRMATALSVANPDERGVNLRSAILFGPRSPKAQNWHLIRQVEKSAGALRLSVAQEAVLHELRDGSANAHPVGTVIYEAGGHAYREPAPKLGTSGVPYTGSSMGYYEIIDALGDSEVSLP